MTSATQPIGSNPGQPDRPVAPPCINSLWIGGPLSTMERLSMLSHLRQGHEYHLWVYDDTDAPEGVDLEDAASICDRSDIFTYQVGQGAGSVSAFSNLFRYRLLEARGGWWCDTDVVALKPFHFREDYVFASQVDRDGLSSTTSCVIKVPPNSDVMRACHARAMAVDRSTLTWGVIGPRLLADMVTQCGLDQFVTAPETFCPTHWFDAEVDPALHEWSLTEASYAVHLWHEMWRRNNVEKDGVHPGTLYDALKAPYAKALDRRPRLRRWLDGLRVAAGRGAQEAVVAPGAAPRRVPVTTPGTPIADWPDARLEASAEQHAYGDRRTALLTREPGGPLVFEPCTTEDHIATPFVPLEPATGGRALTLLVQGHPSADSSCAADLQDQDFNVCASVRCGAGGDERRTVAVSPAVTQVRVVFQAPRLGRVCLPARVRILDHVG